jgi:hypothetical protein
MSEGHKSVKCHRKPPITVENAGTAENSGDAACETERRPSVAVNDIPQYDRTLGHRP